MDEQDAVLNQEALAAWVEPDRMRYGDSRIAREVIVVLTEQRARFAPRSGHPVAIMLDEWIARLEQYAARPLLPVPD